MPKKLKTFKRFRTLRELKVVCKARKWKLCEKYYKAGSDHVRVEFKIKTLAEPVTGWMLVNMFNGRFFGETDHSGAFSSEENKGSLWFDILLETVYTND